MNHVTMFIVTDDGVIAADPVGQSNPRSPQMYKAAIASVTDRPVKYLIYSHDHADHIQGGAVFMDTVEHVISHQLAAPKIVTRNNAVTPRPTLLVGDIMTLEHGGRRIELIYAGRCHSDNSLMIHYPARRLLFAVDFVPVDSLPFRTLNDSYANEWVAALRWIEDNLDFDILIPGHGRLGTKANVRTMREYFVDLMNSIRAARSSGMRDNSAEMVASVRTALSPKYGSWENFGPYLPENVQGIIRMWSEQGGS